jgi:hypothetical protein
MRPIPRDPGTAGIFLALFLSACGLFGVRGRDQDAPKSSSNSDVAARCREMTWATAYASAYQPLDGAGQVIVQITPASLSSKTKASALHHRRGRIIAKVENRGSGVWPKMALTGNSTSCWYVWEGKDGQLRSKFVPQTGVGDSALDADFDIQYQTADHGRDESAWNKPFRIGMVDSLAPAPVQLDSAALIFRGNTGWTTCLINGCCRTRQ